MGEFGMQGFQNAAFWAGAAGALNPEPLTLPPEPQTINSEPCTLHPKPRSLNPEPCTRSPFPQTLDTAP